MKKFAMMIVALMAFAPLFAEQDPNVAYVKFWDDFMLMDNKTVLHQFVDGSVETFYRGYFIEKDMTINDALSNYSDTYNTLKDEMGEGDKKLTSAQISYNMGIWSERMMGVIYKGIAEQNRKDAERIAKAAGGTQQAADAVATLTKQTATNMESLRGSLDSQLAAVGQSNAQLISALALSVGSKTQELEDKISALDANKGADNETVRGLQAEVQKIALEIASMDKAIDALRNVVNDNYSSSLDRYVLLSDYSNTLKRITHFLGNTNANSYGTFRLPIDPTTGQQLPDSTTINSYLGQVQGVVAYIDTDYVEKVRDTDYKYGFVEQVEGTTTNVISSFRAVKNWADNSSIIVSNGVYTVYRYSAITNLPEVVSNLSASVSNVVISVSNVTQVVTTITNDFSRIGGSSNVVDNVISSTNYFFSLSNQFTRLINLSKGFDNASIWTNGEEQVEIKGFEAKADSFGEEVTLTDYLTNRTDMAVSADRVSLISRIAGENEDDDAKVGYLDIGIVKELSDCGFGSWARRQRNVYTTVNYFPQYIDWSETNVTQVVLNETHLVNTNCIALNSNRVLELFGFGNAGFYTFPMKHYGENCNGRLDWIYPDAQRPQTIGQGEVWLKSINIASDTGILGNTGALSLYGFATAENGSRPEVRQFTNPLTQEEERHLVWRKDGQALRVCTDGLYGSSGDIVVGSGTTTNTIRFSSGPAAAMRFVVNLSDNGEVDVSVGALYQ